MGWLMADYNSLSFCHVYFQYVMQIVLMKSLQAGTARYMFSLSLSLPLSFRIIALGNVNVRLWILFRVFTWMHLWSADVNICCGGFIYTAFLMPLNLFTEMQSWGRANPDNWIQNCGLGWLCVLVWPRRPSSRPCTVIPLDEYRSALSLCKIKSMREDERRGKERRGTERRLNMIKEGDNEYMLSEDL